MFGRSRRTAPLHLPPIGGVLCLLLIFVLSSCSRTPEQQVKDALGESIEALQNPDADAYMQQLDFGAPLDSVHQALYYEVIRLQLQREGHEQDVASWRVSEVRFQNDTLATAFYTLYLANGDSLCKGQLMVLTQGKWKLRMKN